MNNQHDTTWHCVICQRETGTLHEVIMGTGNRQTCIDYNIQVPLCVPCHQEAHGGKGKQLRFKQWFCNLLEIDYHKTLQGIIYKRKREYLEEVKDRCFDKLKQWEMGTLFERKFT